MVVKAKVPWLMWAEIAVAVVVMVVEVLKKKQRGKS